MIGIHDFPAGDLANVDGDSDYVRVQVLLGARVTVATESPDLLAHAATVFRTWRLRLSELLVEGGLDPVVAKRFGATLVSAAQGAVVLSRAEHSMEPFELVSEELLSRVPDA